MNNTNNLRISSFKDIASPNEVRQEIPITETALSTVVRAREDIQNIIDGKDDRKIVIVGPCSIHNYDQTLEYARKLNELRIKTEDKLLIIMRTYFEKPRTTVGWKGFLYDPHLDGSYDLQEGVNLSRKLLVEINEMGLPTATEVLGPIVIQYYSDLICWSAIGARTAESQTHRELASGLSMPVGFKNGTEGNLDIAINAILSAKANHSFLGMDEDGKVAIVETTGNEYGHIILRGGKNGPNYSAESIKETADLCVDAGITPAIIVDCSHANSGKDFRNQSVVWHDAWKQIENGGDSIKGFMLESNLEEGNQKIGDNLEYGVSITDSCIGLEETELLLGKSF